MNTMNTLNTLQFTPYAWAKLQFMLKAGDSEVGGFALSEDPKHPLVVTDLYLPKQSCNQVFCSLDGDDIADWRERMFDEGLQPYQCYRIWCHTHPGESPHPSSTDEQTLQKLSKGADWFVMFIIAKGGNTYCRLRMETPSGVVQCTQLDVEVTYEWCFDGSNITEWTAEYKEKVTIDQPKFTNVSCNVYNKYAQMGFGKETLPAKTFFHDDYGWIKDSEDVFPFGEDEQDEEDEQDKQSTVSIHEMSDDQFMAFLNDKYDERLGIS